MTGLGVLFCTRIKPDSFSAGLCLYCNRYYVLHCLDMSHCNTVMTLKFHCSYGTIVLDHLAADGAGFAGGQVTVVAVGQVNADLGSCLHLELVHGFTSLRNVDLVVVLHDNLSPFRFFGKDVFRRNRLFFPQAYFCPFGGKYKCFFSERVANNGKTMKTKLQPPTIRSAAVECFM